jgi:hypothetical protein
MVKPRNLWPIFVLCATAAAIAQDRPLDLNRERLEGDRGGLVLTLGRLATKPNVGANQIISVENRTSRIFARIEVECGFYAGDKLVGNGNAIISALQPGSTGHSNLFSSSAGDADTAKCRISSQ